MARLGTKGQCSFVAHHREILVTFRAGRRSSRFWTVAFRKRPKSADSDINPAQ